MFLQEFHGTASFQVFQSCLSDKGKGTETILPTYNLYKHKMMSIQSKIKVIDIYIYRYIWIYTCLIFVNISTYAAHAAYLNLTGLDSIPGDSQVTQLTSIRSFPPRLQTPGFPACLERNNACTSGSSTNVRQRKKS